MVEHGLAFRVIPVAAAVTAIIATIAVPPAPRFVWNVSASAPTGLYRIIPHAPRQRNDMVIAWLPTEARDFAARRRYVPANVPLVKRVAGMPGDIICALGSEITINGARVATRLARDRQHRPMPWWHGCITLGGGMAFLLMTDSPASFDGRYFGISHDHDIVGLATFMWGPQ